MTGTSTSASVATAVTAAHVLHLGAMSPVAADPHVGAAEGPIDYTVGSGVLLAAADVAEASSTSVSPGSPFGI